MQRTGCLILGVELKRSILIKEGYFPNETELMCFYFLQSIDSYVGSPPKSDGRMIYYHIADDNGMVEGEDMEGYSFSFKGNSLEELTQKLVEETGMEEIIVCSRSPLNGKLFPLRLQLPPNHATMHIVVVPSSSRGEECS